jgi:hypothetical protein
MIMCIITLTLLRITENLTIIIIEVEKICADNSFNRGHIGCAILSISKRIMNEVFDVANDNNYPIYYTDTDSLHCNLEDVPKLKPSIKKDIIKN